MVVLEPNCKDYYEQGIDLMNFSTAVKHKDTCWGCPVRDECKLIAIDIVKRGDPLQGLWAGEVYTMTKHQSTAVRVPRSVTEPIVRAFYTEHPDATIAQAARGTGLNKTTIGRILGRYK